MKKIICIVSILFLLAVPFASYAVAEDDLPGPKITYPIKN